MLQFAEFALPPDFLTQQFVVEGVHVLDLAISRSCVVGSTHLEALVIQRLVKPGMPVSLFALFERWPLMLSGLMLV